MPCPGIGPAALRLTPVNARTHIGGMMSLRPANPGLRSTTAGMKRLGHIFAVLAFAIALLVGAAGGAMAHAGAHDGPMDHHGSHHSPAPSAPLGHDHHKAALAVAATCCPAAEVPAKHVIAVSETVVEASWPPRPDYIPNARDIAPDTPPPKTFL